MRRRVPGVVLLIAVVLATAACGSSGRGHQPRRVGSLQEPASSTHRCTELMSQRRISDLIDAEVSSPVRARIPGIGHGCRWSQTDRKGTFFAIALEAREWAKALPALIEQVRRSRSGLVPEDKLRNVERELAGGLPTDNSKACELFVKLIEVQYPQLDDGSDTVVAFLPTTKNPLALSAQSCVGGVFRTILLAREKGVPNSDEWADRFLHAVNDLRSVASQES